MATNEATGRQRRLDKQPFDQSKTYQGYTLEVVFLWRAKSIPDGQTNAKMVGRWVADELHTFSRIESSGSLQILILLNVFATRAGHVR